MKKMVIGLIIIFLIPACSQQKSSTTKVDPAELWRKNCALCHGANGKLQLNGAKDLSTSLLNKDERILVITKGRNTMAAYENILSKEEIMTLAEYSLTFE